MGLSPDRYNGVIMPTPGIFIDFDNGLWAQDSNGRPYLIR